MSQSSHDIERAPAVVLTSSFVSTGIMFPAPPSTESLIKTISALRISGSDMLPVVVFSWDTAKFWQKKMKQTFRRNWTKWNRRWTSTSPLCACDVLSFTTPHAQHIQFTCTRTCPTDCVPHVCLHKKTTINMCLFDDSSESHSTSFTISEIKLNQHWLLDIFNLCNQTSMWYWKCFYLLVRGYNNSDPIPPLLLK